jgi:hypothetical protein
MQNAKLLTADYVDVGFTLPVNVGTAQSFPYLSVDQGVRQGTPYLHANRGSVYLGANKEANQGSNQGGSQGGGNQGGGNQSGTLDIAAVARDIVRRISAIRDAPALCDVAAGACLLGLRFGRRGEAIEVFKYDNPGNVIARRATAAGADANGLLVQYSASQTIQLSGHRVLVEALVDALESASVPFMMLEDDHISYVAVPPAGYRLSADLGAVMCMRCTAGSDRGKPPAGITSAPEGTALWKYMTTARRGMKLVDR